MKESILAMSARVYIERYPADKIGALPVTGIAEKFNVDISYLSRVFKKYNKITVFKCLEDQRFYRFREIGYKMETPKVKDILEKMNIKNQSYFIRRYKKSNPESPGQFCRRLIKRRKREYKKKWEFYQRDGTDVRLKKKMEILRVRFEDIIRRSEEKSGRLWQ